MYVVMDTNVTDKQVDTVLGALHHFGLAPRREDSEDGVVLNTDGDSPREILGSIRAMPGVLQAGNLWPPYRLPARRHQAADTQIRIGPVTIGGERLAIFAGPCSVENEEMVYALARQVKAAGAVGLRGGAFKPRTSPYSFQGLGQSALKTLRGAADENGLLVITEVLDTRHVEMMTQYADILQVGSRSMENYPLLREVGRSGKPAMLKRGRSATIEEWLQAAEYIMVEGNNNVILCERGIRTFEGLTRNTLDISAIPVVKALSHLPILADPSHGTGLRDKVLPMSRAAVAAGADGLLIEVHAQPDQALSDGAQSIRPEQLIRLMTEVDGIAKVIGRRC